MSCVRFHIHALPPAIFSTFSTSFLLPPSSCCLPPLPLQLALRRPEQAAFAYEEAILAAPNHPEFHVRAAEIALHRALRCPSTASSSSSGSGSRSGDSAAASAAGGLLRAAAVLAASDASSGAVTMAAATAGVGADAASAGALLRQARLHAAEAVRQTESAGADVDGSSAAAAAGSTAGDAPYANGYALAVLADVCWAHITRVASALAPSASSSAAAAVFAHPPPRLFSVAAASESAMPSLAAVVAAAAEDLKPSAGAGSAAAAAADAATATARAHAKDVGDLLHAAATADHEVNASILLHRLAAHGLERLAASAGGGAGGGADAAAAAAAATGPLPFTAVESAAVRGPYARYVIARDALLSAAGAAKPV